MHFLYNKITAQIFIHHFQNMPEKILNVTIHDEETLSLTSERIKVLPGAQSGLQVISTSGLEKYTHRRVRKSLS